MTDRLAGCCVRMAGRFFFIPFALFMFFCQALIYFRCALPGLARVGMSGTRIAALTCLGCFLTVNLLYNYFMTMLVDPGTPWEVVDAALAETTPTTGVASHGETPPRRRCRKCGGPKPPRSHHCSICRRCVLKMDHHCPWFNTCVGFHNQRYFDRFLVYLHACSLVVVLILPVVPAFGIFELMGVADMAGEDELGFLQMVGLPVCWIAAVGVLIVVSLFLGFHTYLVLTNQTTPEFMDNGDDRAHAWTRWEAWRSPYDLGWSENISEVFGPSWSLLWLLLPCLAKPPRGDGSEFRPCLPPRCPRLPFVAKCCGMVPWAFVGRWWWKVLLTLVAVAVLWLVASALLE